MQLYLNSLTQTKLAVFLFPQTKHRIRFVIAVWPSLGSAAGSHRKCGVVGEFVI